MHMSPKERGKTVSSRVVTTKTLPQGVIFRYVYWHITTITAILAQHGCHPGCHLGHHLGHHLGDHPHHYHPRWDGGGRQVSWDVLLILHPKIPRLVHCKNRFWGITESIWKLKANGAVIWYFHHHCVLFKLAEHCSVSNIRHHTIFWPKFNTWELCYFSIQLFYSFSESLQKKSPRPDYIGAWFDWFSALKN